MKKKINLRSMGYADIKTIKPKSLTETEMTIILQNWILEMTNAGLISIELHKHCRKFIKDLKMIPLSQEYQKHYD